MVSRPNRLASPATASTAGGSAAAAGEIGRKVTAQDPESALTLAEEVLGRALRVGATEAEVLAFLEASASRLDTLATADERLAELTEEVDRLRIELRERAAVVTRGRTEAAPAVSPFNIRRKSSAWPRPGSGGTGSFRSTRRW